MDSIWANENRTGTADDGVSGKYDHVVVGAGITGLAAAVMLARAGRSVAVVEARYIGAGTTGRTTGKVSLLQGTRLSQISDRHGPEAACRYVTANQAAQDWIHGFCADRGVEIEERQAITFACTSRGSHLVEQEFKASGRAGLSVDWTETAELPFPTRKAIVLNSQAQIDPMALLHALHSELTSRGVEVHQGIRVTGVHRSMSEYKVMTARGNVTAQSVIIATGTPFLDRGVLFARLNPQRSYAAALQVDEPIPQHMYLGADNPTVSLRTVQRSDGQTLLLVGGFGHTVGRVRSEVDHVEALMHWTKRWFPTAHSPVQWSAQDYVSTDEVPYIGPLLPGSEIYVATGFAKWGMTNGVAAALAISQRCLNGTAPEWADVFLPWRSSQIRSASSTLSANLAVGRELVRGYTHLLRRADSTPPEGDGSVGYSGPRLQGVSTVGERTRAVLPVCTHLGGVLEWNDAECSWDCPLHGSRFDSRGKVLEGPATRDLSTPATDDSQ